MPVLPFIAALDAVEPVVVAVHTNQFKAATPCADWDVHALMNHLYNELAWVPELLAGKTIAEVGDALDGDLVGNDPAGTWRRYANAARQAASAMAPDAVVHLSYGDTPARQYLDEMTGELLVHAWDLARGTGQDFHIPEELAKTVYNLTAPKAVQWRELGLIGPEVAVPESASSEVKLLGLLGRKAAL